MIFDSLKDKCYYYRDLADTRLIPNSYIIIMLDGRSFSNKIKNNFEKPFDDFFVNAMNETAKYLCQHIDGARFAFVQSDEISILISDLDLDSPFFQNRTNKILSLASSMATGKFNQIMATRFLTDDKALTKEDVMNQELYEFDCKAWNVPTPNDVYAWFLFRQIDCVRNSKQQTAQTWLSHKQLNGLKTDEQIRLLEDVKGIKWEDYPAGVKYGRRIVKNGKELYNEKYGSYSRKTWEIEPAPVLFEEDVKAEFMKSLPKMD